jgi:hypothetical protein
LRGRDQHRAPQPEERAGIIGLLAQRPLRNFDPMIGHDLDPLSRGLADGQDLGLLRMFGIHHRLTLSGLYGRFCVLP